MKFLEHIFSQLSKDILLDMISKSNLRDKYKLKLLLDCIVKELKYNFAKHTQHRLKNIFIQKEIQMHIRIKFRSCETTKLPRHFLSKEYSDKYINTIISNKYCL